MFYFFPVMNILALVKHKILKPHERPQGLIICDVSEPHHLCVAPALGPGKSVMRSRFQVKYLVRFWVRFLSYTIQEANLLKNEQKLL
jgi:hypothetical protein